MSAVVAPTLSASGSTESYLDALSVNLGETSTQLNRAAEAIEECNVELLECLREPEAYAERIDDANEGLTRVHFNLSTIQVPSQYSTDHFRLLRGLSNVMDGLYLYSESLRMRDPSRLGDALELIRAGRDDIQAATDSILAETSQPLDMIQITTVIVVIATGGLAVLLVILLRRARSERLSFLHDELATCPQCGEVLDQWWTFRPGQIRQWQTTHLASHERED